MVNGCDASDREEAQTQAQRMLEVQAAQEAGQHSIVPSRTVLTACSATTNLSAGNVQSRTIRLGSSAAPERNCQIA
jgi:hypothetical protein